MKLVVCAPPGEIPDEAQKLSKQLGLPIKTDASYSFVDVIALPEEKKISYKEISIVGHLHSVKVVDEFQVVRNSIIMAISGPTQNMVKPVLSERHMSIFHNRFYAPGFYKFDIVMNGRDILFSGEINVIDG